MLLDLDVANECFVVNKISLLNDAADPLFFIFIKL